MDKDLNDELMRMIQNALAMIRQLDGRRRFVDEPAERRKYLDAPEHLCRLRTVLEEITGVDVSRHSVETRWHTEAGYVFQITTMFSYAREDWTSRIRVRNVKTGEVEPWAEDDFPMPSADEAFKKAMREIDAWLELWGKNNGN